MITTERLKTIKKGFEQYMVEKPKIQYVEMKGILLMFDLLIKESERTEEQND